MPFPSVPFQANVTGSPAFSPDGAREWAASVSADNVTIIALFDDKARVGDPSWSNGKQWCVYQSALTVVTTTPPPTGEDVPDPIPAGAFRILFGGIEYVNKADIFWVKK